MTIQKSDFPVIKDSIIGNHLGIPAPIFSYMDHLCMTITDSMGEKRLVDLVYDIPEDFSEHKLEIPENRLFYLNTEKDGTFGGLVIGRKITNFKSILPNTFFFDTEEDKLKFVMSYL